MFKHLFVLVLLVAAATSASTPAHAQTLTVTSLVCDTYPASFSCEASVSGGTGSYTSVVWGVASGSQVAYYTMFGLEFSRRCTIGQYYSVSFQVTDSAGAFASRTTGFYCPGNY